jgi:hypothetical protein
MRNSNCETPANCRSGFGLLRIFQTKRTLLQFINQLFMHISNSLKNFFVKTLLTKSR